MLHRGGVTYKYISQQADPFESYAPPEEDL